MNLSSKKVKKCKTVGCDCFRWGSFQLCYKHYREKLKDKHAKQKESRVDCPVRGEAVRVGDE